MTFVDFVVEAPSIQLLSSQNSDLVNHHMDEFEKKVQAKNTKIATEWRVKKFATYLFIINYLFINSTPHDVYIAVNF